MQFLLILNIISKGMYNYVRKKREKENAVGKALYCQ